MMEETAVRRTAGSLLAGHRVRLPTRAPGSGNRPVTSDVPEFAS